MSEADTKSHDASQQAPPAQTEHAQVAEQIEEIAAADGASVLGKLSSAKAADASSGVASRKDASSKARRT